MRRFLSATAFVVTLVGVLGAAACGQRFDHEGAVAPAPGDLAADALAALEAKGSAHFVADMKTASLAGSDAVESSVHLEGDASSTALDAEGSVSLGAATLPGRVLVDEHAFFLEFMGRWYAEEEGIADALEEAKASHEGDVWEALATPAGLRRNFGELFSGEVGAGPAVGGVATWRFEGTLDADGIADLARRLGASLTDRDEVLIAKAAEASRIVLVVGQDDHLPRRIEFEVLFTADQLKDLEGLGDGPFRDSANVRTSLELSDFGKPVQITKPDDFKPLDALFDELFSGFE